MRFHQDCIDKIGEAIMQANGKDDCMDRLEIILRDFRQSAINTGRLAGMRDAQARRVGGGPRKRR